jgi:outer membrane lipoprotein SlyB
MLPKKMAIVLALGALCTTAACTDSQEINAMTGALGGAAVGSAFGNGTGKTAAMLAGAAIGGVAGANAPTR